MGTVAALLEAIGQRARTDAESVVPVLELLAQPDRPAADPDGVIHRTANHLNRQRLDDAERRLRAGALTTADVRERLGISRQAVAERVRTGSLAAVKIASRLAYPDWQFAPTGLAARLGEVLRALRAIAPAPAAVGPAAAGAAGAGEAAGFDVRAADAVMRHPQPGLPDRMALADLLALGDVDEVLHRLAVRSEQS